MSLYESIMNLSVLDLSQELIKIQSDPDKKKELNQALNLVIQQLSWFTIETFEQNWSKSILVYSGDKKPDRFKVILNGHLDVIPGKPNQYIPHIVWDRLYGVWSMDMKSNVACLIKSFCDVAWKVNYPLGLQIVTDEEIWGFDGTLYQIQQWVKTDFVIAGETTNFNIVHKAKWIIWLKIKFTWVTAHWAYPWKWDNALWKAQEFLTHLKKMYPVQFESRGSTINLSKIETSNNSFNKIPDDCTLSLDIRYIPWEKESILDNIKSISHDCELEIITDEPALFVEENNYFIEKLKQSTEEILWQDIVLYWANWSSDARHYSIIDAKWIEFWPIGWWIWTDEEWVDIGSLDKYCQILESFLFSLES